MTKPQTPHKAASIVAFALIACSLMCVLSWVWGTFFVDETTRMEVHVTQVCASIMTVTEAIDRCNAEYVVSLYADILIQCEQTYGNEPFNADGYRTCMEDLGIRLQ